MNMKTYPCGCEAGPAEEVPDYCPDHGLKLPTEEQADNQIEAQKRAMGLSDPFPPGHLGDYMVQIKRQVNDLAMLVRSLVWTLDKYAPDHSMTWKAKDYLTRNNLQGSVLRDPEDSSTSTPCPACGKDFPHQHPRAGL